MLVLEREKKEENEVVTSHNVNRNLDRQCINEYIETTLGLDATNLRARLSASVLLEV